MLYDIEHRGGDATGAAWINPRNGKRVISKAPVGAGKFVPSAGDKLCAGATSAILHTRFATQGSKDIAGNNHPIPRGRIVLTHNGHINNDKELFKQLGVPRVAQVDSEAVAALVAFSKVKPWEFLTEIYGTPRSRGYLLTIPARFTLPALIPRRCGSVKPTQGRCSTAQLRRQ